MARQFIIQSEALPAIHGMDIAYADELNTQQLEAVTWGGGVVLVVAGAGTGKTRTLVYRVAYLVETRVPPESVVLLTFSRRAASEMLNRATLLLDGRCNRVRGGTFHAFCLTILKKYATKIGFPSNFTILDASDSADVIDVLRGRLSVDTRGKRFPRKRTLQTIFSAIRNRGVTISELVENSYPQFLEFSESMERLFLAYSSYKKEQGVDGLRRSTGDDADAFPAGARGTQGHFIKHPSCAGR